ncbi:MAG: serine hydrolase [Bacteroidota bacterium]
MDVFKNSVILLFTLFSASCANPEKGNRTVDLKNEIDQYLTKTMELHNIPGLALAVVEDGEIVYENYFGKASLEDDSAVDKNTLFRIFSATKLITSTGVFQLIQNGQLSLNDTISKHLDNLPVHWKNVKIKHLLTHSSGLPDIVRYESSLSDEALMEQLSKDKMDFATGHQFRYNQTNYWLLAQIIENITGKPFDEYVITNQFASDTNGVLFSSNSQETIPNRATRYYYNGQTEAFEKDNHNSGTRGHSGNGLNITLNKFMEWNTHLDNNILLDKVTKSMMWSPFDFTNQKDQFLHGWNNYSVNTLDSYGFSGGNLAAFRKFVKNDVTIVLLSNGYEIPAFDIIINDIARIAIPELSSKRLVFEEDVMRFVAQGQFDKAKQSFQKLKEENPNANFENVKWNINGIGNAHTAQKELEKAFQVFKFNAEANPNWWVSLTALAEIYEMQKDTPNAVKNYQRAIVLNENNEGNYNEWMEDKINELNVN